MPLIRENLLPDTFAVAPMTAHAVITVEGPDAATLLQGQLSNDIHALDAAPAQLSTLNSPKGRVLAFLRVLAAGPQRFRLVVDRDIADAFLQRLRLFVLRSKVSIDASPEFSGLCLLGPDAPRVLADAGLPAPAAGESARYDELVLLGLPGPAPRIEIYGPAAGMPSFTDATSNDAELARWDILFHLPRINDTNRDQHVAQHLGLDELGAISFRKGCYTGQEIIARMKYLGKVKKGARIFTGSNATPGDSIRNEDDRSVGEVVNVAELDGETLVLASVNLDAADQVLKAKGAALVPASFQS